MNTQQLLNEILAVLKTVQHDKAALEKIHEFMFDEIYEEPEAEESHIPEKYQKAIHDIAESINAGFVCLVNTDTLEFEEIPADIVYQPLEYEDITCENSDPMKFHSWENVTRIEPLGSNRSFGLMEQFIEKLDDEKFGHKLESALRKRRPFANFRNLIDDSNYRQNWFDFKQKQLEIHVWKELKPEINYES